MRRALSIGRVVMVYLLLGFVTTWAVAWGLAMLPPGSSLVGGDVHRSERLTTSYRAGMGSARKHYYVLREWEPGEFSRGIRGLSLLPLGNSTSGWHVLNHIAEAYSSNDWGIQTLPPDRLRRGPSHLDDARGFPFLALWCTWGSLQVDTDKRLSEWPSVKRDLIRGGVPLTDHPNSALRDAQKFRALPYYPIWSGLALNTAFYALLFFAVVRTARAYKHARRYKRGLCPRCKYDRLFDYRVPCPECGHEGRVVPAMAVV